MTYTKEERQLSRKIKRLKDKCNEYHKQYLLCDMKILYLKTLLHNSVSQRRGKVAGG